MTRCSIIPLPASIEIKPGSFELPLTMTVSADPFAAGAAALLATAFGGTVSPSTGAISIEVGTDPSLGDEGYTLDVAVDRVSITAVKPAGAFYAVQSLIQLLDAEVDGSIPCVAIVDRPAYRWRGLMLDCGRHFWPVPFVKRTIDLIAQMKFNTFHWHLTEDQGWRIEIKKYPNLTEIGGWRDDGEGGKYGGFYTQDQIRDVVAYAARRHVTVVPEIEMPGHATAAVAAYPEFSCAAAPVKVATTWGVFEDVFCPGKDETLAFIFDVLTEVLALFPGPFIHVGGDECPKTRWKLCPDCRARIEREKLTDEHGLQSWFIGRVDRWLSDNGRRLIGWDEILEGGLAPCAAVMSWRGTAGGIEAAGLGHDVVMSPGTHCYLDHYQSKSPGQPKAIGGFTPIEKVYEFEPAVPELTPAQAGRVLGGQGNVWTEYMPTEAQVDYMVWPRAVALAEALWTPNKSRDYADFKSRLPAVLAKLKSQGVKYFVEPEVKATD